MLADSVGFKLIEKYGDAQLSDNGWREVFVKLPSYDLLSFMKYEKIQKGCGGEGRVYKVQSRES